MSRIYGNKIIDPVVDLRYIKYSDFMDNNIDKCGYIISNKPIHEFVKDIQKTYTNIDIPTDDIAKLVAEHMHEIDYDVSCDIERMVEDKIHDFMFETLVEPNIQDHYDLHNIGIILKYKEELKDCNYSKDIIDTIIKIDYFIPKGNVKTYTEYDNLLKVLHEEFKNDESSLRIVKSIASMLTPKLYPWEN